MYIYGKCWLFCYENTKLNESHYTWDCINSYCRLLAAGSSSSFTALYDTLDKLWRWWRHMTTLAGKNSPSLFLRLLFSTVTHTTRIIRCASMWMMIYTDDVAVPELNTHRAVSVLELIQRSMLRSLLVSSEFWYSFIFFRKDVRTYLLGLWVSPKFKGVLHPTVSTLFLLLIQMCLFGYAVFSQFNLSQFL